jgi:thiol-disulfide isomerase/thioredoxin
MKSSKAYLFLAIATACLGAYHFYGPAGGLRVISGTGSGTPVNLQQLTQDLKPLKNLPALHEDRPRIMHFWASWCGPCRQEFPSLLETLPELSTKADFFLVSEDEDPAAYSNFLKNVDPQLRWGELYSLDAKQTLSRQFQINQLPETLIFDSNNRLIRKISGSMNWQNSKNLSFLKSLPSK